MPDDANGPDLAVIGVDIGTTSTKSVAFDVAGHVRAASSEVGYPLSEPTAGYAEQDPDQIVAAVMQTVREASAKCDCSVVGLSFSAAMHSLIGLDGDGVPLTPSVTWADLRASRQAERMRAVEGGLALHRRTGTPLHPMAPLAKLVWFRESEPALFERVRHWVGIKEYVLLRLCGELAIDHSIASGTGLLDISRLDWDPEALRLAGITADRLSRLAPTTHLLRGLTAAAATHTGLAPDTNVVIGAGDGPLANLGLGAVQPGVAACSIGTSGALRVMVDKPGVDPRGGVFCYALTQERWTVGGGINNGGVVLEWAADALAPELGDPESLLATAAQAPAGSGGLLMLPYLLGERAPHWSPLPRGAYVGLTREHRQPHLIRAALEGVCQQLALVLQSMRDAGNEVREIRATGGFARSPLWRQMLADTLDMDIGFLDSPQASSLGAALLGMQALGLVESIDVAAELVQITHTVCPEPAAAATYAAQRPIFAGLYEALIPTFAALRALPANPPDTASP